MATKPESKETAVAVAAPEKPSAGDKPGAEKAPAAEKAHAPPFSIKAWIPALAVIALAPAASWALTQFVLLPRLEKKLTLAAPADGAVAADAAPAAPSAGDKKDAKGTPIAPPTYKFDNMVVNLAGTMGTRYLKTTFIVSGSDPKLEADFEDKKAQLTDVTLNVLSSLTLADLEEPGAKNVLREKLVNAYNQALGSKIAEQVWFSDFVVQ
jgi:flagellar protein FliL